MKKKGTVGLFLTVVFIFFGLVLTSNQKNRILAEYISQPNLSKSVLKDLPVAEDNRRVDLKVPTFSNPTNINNVLFPVKMSQVLLAGHIDGRALQVTYSLLPGTRKIKWNGKEIETVIIQYNAFLDRRIIESATDWYAQSDDGAVWYFGEDVFNYIDGQVDNTSGTWLAERDGPAALIMPANPQVGNVFRVENIPGKAFEEITVKKINATIDGAFGPIKGAMIVDQLHMDGTHSDKVFVPGIGEYVTATSSDLEVVALALPANALSGPVPKELSIISRGALAIYESAGNGKWESAIKKLEEINNNWNTLKTKGIVSKQLAAQMERDLVKLKGDALAPAVLNKDRAGTRQYTLNVGLTALDMELQYLTRNAVDVNRFRLWTMKAIVDAEAQEQGLLLSDVIALEMVEQRLLSSPNKKGVASLSLLTKKLRSDAANENFDQVLKTADQILNSLDKIFKN